MRVRERRRAALAVVQEEVDGILGKKLGLEQGPDDHLLGLGADVRQRTKTGGKVHAAFRTGWWPVGPGDDVQLIPTMHAIVDDQQVGRIQRQGAGRSRDVW